MKRRIKVLSVFVCLIIVALGFAFLLLCCTRKFAYNSQEKDMSVHNAINYTAASNSISEENAINDELIDLDYLKSQMDDDYQVLLEESSQIYDVGIITLQQSMGVIVREEYIGKPVYAFNVSYTKDDIVACLILYCSLDGKVLVGYGYSD